MTVYVRYGICVVMMFVAILGHGQSFSIVSLESEPTDLSASTHPRIDMNGKKCGLMKVQCVLEGLKFSGNIVGDIEFADAEYWVYLTDGTKKMTVKHPKLLPLNIDFTASLGSSIQSGHTYCLVLSIPEALYNAVVANMNGAPTPPAPSRDTQPAVAYTPQPPPITVSELTAKADAAYSNGNYAEAITWYSKAAEQRDAHSQNKLGDMHYFGKGVQQDFSEALRWYRKSAEQGNANAQYNLGLMYFNGVTKDLPQAKEWWEKAASRGNKKAKENLEKYFGN